MNSNISSRASLERAADGLPIAATLHRADTFVSQMRGLIGWEIALGEALLLTTRPPVHTAFMRYPIDAAFVAASDGDRWRVLRVETLLPWRVSSFVLGANAVIEMRAGSALTQLRAGDTLVRVVR